MWSSEEQGVETTSWSSRHGFNVSPSIYLLFNDKAINNPVEEKKSRGKKRRAREKRAGSYRPRTCARCPMRPQTPFPTARSSWSGVSRLCTHPVLRPLASWLGRRMAGGGEMKRGMTIMTMEADTSPGKGGRGIAVASTAGLFAAPTKNKVPGMAWSTRLSLCYPSWIIFTI